MTPNWIQKPGCITNLGGIHDIKLGFSKDLNPGLFKKERIKTLYGMEANCKVTLEDSHTHKMKNNNGY